MDPLRILICIFLTLSTSVGFAGDAKANPLFAMAAKGQLKELRQQLEKGGDINQTNQKGETLLMTAAGLGQKAITQFLISKKAALNTKDQEQNCALYYAITNEQPATAKLLIEAGAELTNLNETQETALILASSVNDAATIKALMAKDKNLINKANQDGKTPLLEAARHGNRQTLMLLLNAGADKSLKNKSGKTALDIAKKAQNPDAIKLLEEKKP